MLRFLRMDLQYEGTRYFGFAAQPGLPTIQGEVEHALRQLLGEVVHVTPAGRTDAGVHASGQVISFATRSSRPSAVVSRALNALLPEDIVAGPCREVLATFDARRSARQRHYRYAIWNDERPNLWQRAFTYHVADKLDISKMGRAASKLVGKHDFASFIGHASQDSRPRSPVRTIARAEWEREGSLLQFRCSGDAFARHMVRGMVGTLLWVGRGRLSPEDFGQVLSARDRRAAGPNAPARGLTLVAVDYDEETQA